MSNPGVKVGDEITTDSTTVDNKWHGVPMKVFEVDDYDECVRVEPPDPQSNCRVWTFYFNEITSIVVCDSVQDDDPQPQKPVANGTVINNPPDPIPQDVDARLKQQRDDILSHVFNH